MGNWNINIQGVGSHHNKNSPDDANAMAKAFVASLARVGHVIESASFTHGAKDDLKELAAERAAHGTPAAPA